MTNLFKKVCMNLAVFCLFQGFLQSPIKKEAYAEMSQLKDSTRGSVEQSYTPTFKNFESKLSHPKAENSGNEIEESIQSFEKENVAFIDPGTQKLGVGFDESKKTKEAFPEFMDFNPGPDLSTGAFSFSIPINTPHSRMSVFQGLKITYNSGRGNSHIGVGWNISLKAIERNQKFGIKYQENQFIFRDGDSVSELFSIGENEYKTKIQNENLRIKRLESEEINEYWEVTDTKGTRYFFGLYDMSRQSDPRSSDKVFKWCLDKIIDARGNYVEFQYKKDQGEVYPETVSYSGNDDLPQNPLPPAVKLNLIWENRNDSESKYHPQFQIKTEYRLKTIIVTAKGVPLKSYEFGYTESPSTKRSLLNNITILGSEQNSDRSEPRSLTLFNFEYQGNVGSWVPSDPWTGPNPNSLGRNCIQGDYNGDGRGDIACHPPSLGIWQVGISNSLGTGWDYQFWEGPAPPLAGFSCLGGDYNGDGLSDVACHGEAGEWHLALSTGSQWITESWPGGPTHIYPGQRCIGGDYNGDGKADLGCLARENDRTWQIYLSTGNSWESASWSDGLDLGDFHFGLGLSFIPGDFNGDGKTDLAERVSREGKWDIALSTGSSWKRETWENGPPQFGVLGYFCQPGDFNGDRKTDIACWPHEGTTYWYVALSMGGERWDLSTWSNGPRLETFLFHHCVTGDFNGDGKTDIAWKPREGPYWRLSLSTGSDFVHNYWEHGPVNVSSATQCLGMDVDGDGKSDLTCFLGENNWKVSRSAGPFPDLLVKIKNAFGGITKINYSPSSRYKNKVLPMILHTVDEIRLMDGRGNNKRTAYWYEGGFYHIEAREFRGFNHTKVKERWGLIGEGVLKETWFHQGDELFPNQSNPESIVGYMAGKPYLEKTINSSGFLQTEKTTIYTADEDGNAPFFNPPSEIITKTCEEGLCRKSIREKFYFDQLGNLFREENYGDDDIVGDERGVVRSFAFNLEDWIVSLPSKETSLGGAEFQNKLSHKTYFYDGNDTCQNPSTRSIPTKGDLTRTVTWLGGDKFSEVRSEFDFVGNQVCFRDANGNFTQFEFDESMTFKIAEINAMGHLPTHYEYYGLGFPMDKGGYGQLKTVIDSNEAKINYEYDQYGREKLITKANGEWTRKSYLNISDPGRQLIEERNSEGLFDLKYFDGFGRTWRRETSGEDSAVVIEDSTYNSRGLLHQVSLPYFKDESPSGWLTFYYDSLGRITKKEYPDGTSTLKCFSFWKTIELDQNGHIQIQTFDAYGQLIQIEKFEGIFDQCKTNPNPPYSSELFEYNGLGHMIGIIHSNGAKTELHFDPLGNMTSFLDLDRGRWDFVYDANNNLIEQTDSKGNITFFQYDRLNRLVQKDFKVKKEIGKGDLTVTYDGPEPYGIGRRWKQKRRQSSSSYLSPLEIEYTYDPEGRIQSIVELYSGDKDLQDLGEASFKMEFSYDGIGRLTKVKYPDTKSIVYNYNGPYLNTINDSEGMLYKLKNYNPYGKPSKVLRRNQTSRELLYYDKGSVDSDCKRPGFKICKIIDYNSNGSILLSLKYEFDNGGNVNAVRNFIGTDQIFSYDDFDRLSKAQGPYGEIEYKYDKLNNIIFNSKVGDMLYDEGRPHLPILIGDDLVQYDKNGYQIKKGERAIEYDSDGRPISIRNSDGYLKIAYDIDGKKKETIFEPFSIFEDVIRTRYIGDNYECIEKRKKTIIFEWAFKIFLEGKDKNRDYCQKFIIANDSKIAMQLSPENQIFFLHKDFQGSILGVSDNTEEFQQTFSFEPFGLSENHHVPNNSSINYRFHGKEYLESADLYYFETRFYDPQDGLFVSPDLLVETQKENPILSPYVFLNNNPISYIDPNGQSPIYGYEDPGFGSLYMGGFHSNINNTERDELTDSTDLSSLQVGAVGESKRDYDMNSVFRGIDAHTTISNKLHSQNRGFVFDKWGVETENDYHFFWGRPDVIHPKTKKLWEIKPNNPTQVMMGLAQLELYTATSDFSTGSAHKIFRGKPSMTLKGQYGVYTYRYGGNGLILYTTNSSTLKPRSAPVFMPFPGVNVMRTMPNILKGISKNY